jgi:predicted HicB family RNase H-like nuclease
MAVWRRTADTYGGKPEDGNIPLEATEVHALQAVELAKREGISLNQFIALAVVEKIARLEIAR